MFSQVFFHIFLERHKHFFIHISQYTNQNAQDQKIISCKGVEKEKHLSIMQLDFKVVDPLWKSIWMFQDNWKYIYLKTQKTTLGHIPKDTLLCHKGMCSIMFIKVLFIITRQCKQTRCPTMKEYIQKMCSIYTMDYYSDIKN